MNEAKRRYKKSCKTKVITFYKKDKDLLDFINKINFQKVVKDYLKDLMEHNNEIEIFEKSVDITERGKHGDKVL